MAITQTVAQIDVMVNGTAALNNLASTYLTVQRNATSAVAAVQRWNTTHSSTVGQLTSMVGGLNNYSRQLATHANNVRAANTATGSWGGSIVRLTQSMVLFSVLLPLVKLPQTAIQSFQQFIQVGTQWETQVRAVASLMGAQQAQYAALDGALLHLKGTYALTNEEVGITVKQIATTLDVMQRNTAGMTAAQKATQDFNDTLTITTDIAQLSRAAFTDMGSTQNAVFTILATGRLTIDQVSQATDLLFRTVQVGRTTFDQFNSAAQRFLPFWEDWIQAATTADDRMSRLTSTLDVYNAASLGLGSQRAATGIGQVSQALTKMNATQMQIIGRMEQIRRTQGLGEQYNITPEALYNLNSQVDVFSRLNNVLGENSPIIDRYVANLERLGKVDVNNVAAVAAARAEGSKQLEQSFLGSKTAQAAFTEANSPGRLGQVTSDRATSTGLDPATQYYLENPEQAAARVKAAYETVQTGVFQAMGADYVRVNIGIANMFQRISDGLTAGAGGHGIFDRLRYIGSEIMLAFTDWYNGDGKSQIIQFGHDLGYFISDAIISFFSGKGAMADAGKQFAMSFTAAIGDNLPAMLSAVIQSAVGQAVLSFTLFRAAGLPAPIAAGAAAVTTSGLQSGGLPGQLMAMGLLGFGGLTAGRALLNRPLRFTGAGAARVPVAGSSVAGIFGGATSGIPGAAAHRSVIASMTGPDYASGAELHAQGITSVRAGTTGRYQFVSPTGIYHVGGLGAVTPGGAASGVNRAMGGPDPMEAEVIAQRQRLSTTGSSTARNLRVAGAVGVPLLMGGIGAVQALGAEPGTRSEAMLSSIGGMLGGIGGGLLGALVPGLGETGISEAAGFFGGQMGGSWLGGMGGKALAPWLEPMLSPGYQAAQTGTGAGGGVAPDAAAAAEMQASLVQGVADGLDSSNTGIHIASLDRKAIVGSGFGSIAMAGSRPGAATTPGTGGGPLSSNFVDQINTGGALTAAQSQAACGPAATAFFSKAYGRNPTLLEAYNLQSQLQGGDIANLSGSNITQMGAALTQMNGGVVNNTVDTKGADWGRLANNATAGIPGIVNIGPNPATGFPGHFLQIAGWDRPSNSFNVGVSGTTISRWGGKALMTPAEMQAIGPILGAIYGTDVPAGAGAAAGTSGGGTPNAAASSSTAKAALLPLAMALQASNGIPWQVTMAIAGNETAYGTAGVGKMNNLFGMQGPNGDGRFAGYANIGQSVNAFGDLMNNPRYAGALAAGRAGDVNGMLSGLRDAHYVVDEPGFPAQAWVNQTQGIAASLTTPGGGTGTGPGGGPMGGGGITINGPLIGTVVLGAGSTEEQANELATILADLLDESHLTAGGSIGQTRLLTP